MTNLVPPKQLSAKRMPEAVEPTASVIVYICPTKGCGDYYAQPAFRPDHTDLTTVQVRRSQNDGSKVLSHARIDCPQCRAKGKRVARVGYIVTQVVPLDAALKALRSD
jgi:hypothetical protein